MCSLTSPSLLACDQERAEGHVETIYGIAHVPCDVFAMVMLLACVVDQTPQLCCALFRAVWAKMGSRRHVWERMRSWSYDDRLTSMRELCEARFYGLEKPRPILRIDSSYPLGSPCDVCWKTRRFPSVAGACMPRSRDVPMLHAIPSPFCSRCDQR
jgi:hypothetical protein